MKKTDGFAVFEAVLILVIIGILSFTGWYVVQARHNADASLNSNHSTNPIIKKKTQAKATTSTDPYAGWQTYTDTGETGDSGIAFKYPSGWQVKVGGSNSVAWTIGPTDTTAPKIGVRYVFLDSTMTPEQEWDECPSADACGPAVNSTKISGTSSTVNGLSVYSTEMQVSNIPYYTTVIKGDKPLANGTVVFVEFTITNPVANTLDTYNKIVASATF